MQQRHLLNHFSMDMASTPTLRTWLSQGVVNLALTSPKLVVTMTAVLVEAGPDAGAAGAAKKPAKAAVSNSGVPMAVAPTDAEDDGSFWFYYMDAYEETDFRRGECYICLVLG